MPIPGSPATKKLIAAPIKKIVIQLIVFLLKDADYLVGNECEGTGSGTPGNTLGERANGVPAVVPNVGAVRVLDLDLALDLGDLDLSLTLVGAIVGGATNRCGAWPGRWPHL